MHLARLQYLGKEGIFCEVHVAGGDPVQHAPDHGGGEDQHLLPLNASKQVQALIIHYTIYHMCGSLHWMLDVNLCSLMFC